MGEQNSLVNRRTKLFNKCENKILKLMGQQNSVVGGITELCG
jgi:hypothetical protein